MCFSATGSFAASGLLATIGAVSVARNTSPAYRLFAAIPLVFAGQQAAEGVVWLTMHDDDGAALHRVAVDAFLGVALVVWPVWMPLSLRRVERDPARARWLLGLLWAGVLVSGSAVALLVQWQPVAQMAGHSIRYVYSSGPFPWRPGVQLAAYALPTVVPFFVSSGSLARTTGIALIVSLIVAMIVERDALTSVWCFFAAILSGLVLGAVIVEQRIHTEVAVP